MNNSDFRRLLLTNDKELISELTKAPKAKKRNKRPPPKFRGKGKGKGGGEEGKPGQRHADGKDGTAGEQGNQYRDRAKERRELKGEYEQIAAEWENHGEVSVDESKYLGGDFDHTHLVKGLDYALLTKVRTELTKQKKAEEIQQVHLHKKGQKKQRKFQSDLGRRVWNAIVETLHPHHSTFKQRMEKMSQAISMGQRMRGAPSVFLPGRMFYEFDTEMQQTKTDIPRIVYTSKEDAPKVDDSKSVAPILPETVTRVQEALQRAAEERKQRKRDKTAGTEPSYTVAQKIVATKHKAKDVDNDIFPGAGAMEITEHADGTTAARLPLLQDVEQPRKAKEDSVLPRPQARLPLFQDVERPRKAKEDPVLPRPQLKAPARPRAVREEDGLRFGVCPEDPESLEVLRDEQQLRDLLEDAKKRRAQLGEKMDGKSQGKKEGKKEGKKDESDGESDPKKRKMTEAQQWQKIEQMIKKGKHSSLDQLEAKAAAVWRVGSRQSLRGQS